jgi:hypothetical protein
MRIITAYPVIMDRKVIANKFAANTMNFSSFDASGKPSNSNEWKSFQKWFNAKGYTPALTVDGIPGTNTNKAWETYGAKFTADRMALSGTLLQTFGPVTTTTTTTQSTTPSADDQEKMKKLGYFWDKAKGVYTKAQESGVLDSVLNVFGLGAPKTVTQTEAVKVTESGKQPMSNTTKAILIGGGALVLITIIALVTKSKRK